ncbi:hypothetical protein [Piscinibacter sp. XHJ-5]|uniref:hypothetical protein n=1 Tax=Piscinibacter sp. XHJ-5 TaxID=3037797 RepID=UPI0024536503|nr:hypothetical protein [Piscinibacter sp. XHJ-5]
MSLLGKAALAMWWDIAPEVKADFEHWHAHEHFPERLGIPGFRRATRWSSASDDGGMFVMYELDAFEVLSSPPYVARLNAPTPWSQRLMPHHRNMVRSQCHVLESHGGGVARHALTMRFSPAAGREAELRAFFAAFSGSMANQPGFTGGHLLKHQAPDIAATTEQKIRNNADQAADWVFVACGYELSALERLTRTDLSEERLHSRGATPGGANGLYTVSCSATATDCT